MVGFGNEVRFSSPFGFLKLDYPNKSSILTSFINGTFEIYNVDGHFFETLIILGVNSRNYDFQLIDKEVKGNTFHRFDDVSNVSLGLEENK